MKKRLLITGIAGFIGSHTAEMAISRGWDVVGIDSITNYYDVELKKKNMSSVKQTGAVQICEGDLLTWDLDELLVDVDYVLHCAAQPGVRDSWNHFDKYVSSNVLATQRLLDASVKNGVQKLVYSSSSSVYGDAQQFPVFEGDELSPVSPYGITKLAGEQLCASYSSNFGLDVTSLRYFTVYGPRQRPDMAIHRLITAAMNQTPFPLYGDGSFVRDFTYVSDVANANLSALESRATSATVINIAGGESTSMSNLVNFVNEVVGDKVPIQHHAEQPGDVIRTGGDTQKALKLLSWAPTTKLLDGIRHQFNALSNL